MSGCRPRYSNSDVVPALFTPITTRFARRLSDVCAPRWRKVASMADDVPDKKWGIPDWARRRMWHAVPRSPVAPGLGSRGSGTCAAGATRQLACANSPSGCGLVGARSQFQGEAMSRRTWAVFAVAALVVGSSVGAPGESSGASARTCMGHTATRVGTAGNDVIKGTPGPDVIVGLAGDDTIRGRGGKDIICGNRGADRLLGGRRADRVSGGMGADHEVGGQGHDVLRGGADNDWMAGKRGPDKISGGPGADTLKGGRNRDRLSGGPDDDRLVGGRGGDRQFGSLGSDTILAGTGTDRLIGGDGDDFLDAADGVGDDSLRGSTGTDICAADPGDAVFDCP